MLRVKRQKIKTLMLISYAQLCQHAFNTLIINAWCESEYALCKHKCYIRNHKHMREKISYVTHSTVLLLC